MRGGCPILEELEWEARVQRVYDRMYRPVDATVVRGFLDAYIRPEHGRWLTAAQIYAALKKYCEAAGVGLSSRQVLGRELRKRYEWTKIGRIIYLDVGFSAETPPLWREIEQSGAGIAPLHL